MLQKLSILVFLKISIFDFNECVVSDDKSTCWNHEENPLCKEKCINSDGSYECECSHGYYLLEKGICIDKSNWYKPRQV